MPHFSKSTHKFVGGLDANKEYRLTAWINLKTPWNDANNRYDPMSEDQRQQCEELFRQFQASGCQISVTISERTDATDDRGNPDVRNFPVASRVTMYPNNRGGASHIGEKMSVDTTKPPESIHDIKDDYEGFA